MKKAIVTGITGQDGAYLAQFLLSKEQLCKIMVESDIEGLKNNSKR